MIKRKVFVFAMIGLMLLGSISMGLMAYDSVNNNEAYKEDTQEVVNFLEGK